MVDIRRFLLSAIGCRLSAYRYPLLYWTVFPKAGGGRLRRRGDSPALTRGLRVVFASLRGRIRVAALEYIPGRNRVQAPAAPGFYRSCADALTDGFCPQSGLVQRGVFYAACRQRPLWWLAPPPSLPLRGGTMDAGQWYQSEFMAAAKRKPYNRASPGGKQANRPVGRWKCTPSAYGTSPGGGGFSTLMPRDAYEFKS